MGMQTVTAHLDTGAERLDGTAEVYLMYFEPRNGPNMGAKLDGNLTATFGSYVLKGSFAAPHCPMLDIYCV
jgi:hypothetical protein